MRKRSRVLLWILRRRSPLLMCLLVALIIASPLADEHPLTGAVIDILVLLVILSGASYSGNPRIIRSVVLPLAALWLVARAMDAIAATLWQVDLNVAPMAGLALSCAILWGLLHRFGMTSRVTSAIISEAFISYLVIAIANAQLYRIVDRFLPGAFTPPTSDADTSSLLYFSMVTLTCVGYGDIVPANRFIRLVAGLESMTGIFYIAVVVSRLVTSYTPRPLRVHGIRSRDEREQEVDEEEIGRS
jgi:Ion channel